MYCHIVFLNCVPGFCFSDGWELRALRAVLRAGSSWAAQLTGPGRCLCTLDGGCYLASLYVCSNSFDFVQCIVYISLNSVPFILNISECFLYSNFCAFKKLETRFH